MSTHRLFPAEMNAAVLYLMRHETATAFEMGAGLNCDPSRARQMLQVLCLPPIRERTGTGGGTRYRYRLHPDYVARMTKRMQEQEARAKAAGRRIPPPARDMYPTGDPTHFDTDWLGRVVYVGPVRCADARFEVSRNDEQSY
jgi:hypothetical protein